MRERVAKALGAQAFGQVVQVIVRLLEVPAFLSLWTATRYGEWLLIAAIPTYLAFADGGFATTTGREMTMRLSAGDQVGALRAFQSSLALLSAIAAALLGTLLVLLFGTRLLEALVPSAYMSLDVKLAFLLLSSYVLAGFLGGLYYGVFSAVHRYDVGTWIHSTGDLTDLLFALAGVLIFGTLAGSAAGMLVSRLALLTADAAALRRLAPWCRLGFTHASRDVLRQLAVPAAGSLAIPIGMAGNISGMRILVGAVLGPATVPLFSAMRTLARTAQMPTLFIIRILEPELAIAFGQGRLDTFRMLVRRSSQIASWSGLLLTAAVLVAGHLLFPIWVHHRFSLNVPTFLMLLAASALNGLWYTALQAAYATNRTQAVALPFVLIYGLLCVVLGWGLMLAIGIAGAALSLLIVELAMCAITIPQALRLSGESWANLLATIVRPPSHDFLDMLRARRARKADEGTG